MARSKQSKRKKQQAKQRAFYETLAPVVSVDARGMRELADRIETELAGVLGLGRIDAQQLLVWWRRLAMAAKPVGRSGAEVAWWLGAFPGQFWADTTPYRRVAQRRGGQAVGELRRVGARLAGLVSASWAAAGAYAPAVGGDLGRLAERLRRAAWGRRMRSAYLALMAAGALAGVVLLGAVSASTLALYAKDIASPAMVAATKQTGITILDRNGQVLYQGYGAPDAKPVTLAQIPQPLKDATLAAEDPTFYSHSGFSWRATARAAWVDVVDHGKVEGGSTLTQQLVKNTLLTSDKTFARKYEEVVLAMEMEHRYSKDQILAMYLNDTFYGQGSTGVEVAAETYFHRPVGQLDLSQSAMIAGLALGPSRFDPSADPQAATDRRNYVLDRMVILRKITATQAAAAKAEPLVAYARSNSIQAPHFVFYVLDQLRAEYGERAIENDGMTVRTTLDLNKQNAAQQIVAQQVSRLASHHVSNGGLISIIPSTGDIISMVGSIGYDTPGFGAVNVTLSDLQPGSSFKPIAYATAFMKGWNGSTQVDDAPMVLPNGNGTPYIPQNYDGKFRGPVTLRRALANSLNIPALKVMRFAGLPDVLATAHNLGITTLNDPSSYGLSLVLGAGDVRPIDMATVYATFANGGARVEPRAILGVTDRTGKDVTKQTRAAPKPVLDPRYAYMITSILSDNRARTEEFGAGSPLLLDRPDAAKTGTTNDFRDNWTVGYTPNLATAVWVGNNDHSAMQNVDGITGAAPIWHDYMETALADMPVEPFVAPAGVTTAKVCAADGGLANPWDTNTYDEVFPTDQPLTRQCGTTAPVAASPVPETPPMPSPIVPEPPVLVPPHGKQPVAG